MAEDQYPKNINLYIPDWLHIFQVTFSIFNLSLAAFTFVFQLTHKKTQRNMGRFFLLILFLQTIDKANLFIQELAFHDLSVPFYEIRNGIQPRSLYTNLCTTFGIVRNCIGFLSQFYCLWLAVLIKQILKDPIHRVKRYEIIYHALTIIISMTLTFINSRANYFGVEEGLQCGIMNSQGMADTLLMMLPFILAPIQLYLIVKILRQTPYIVRMSLRRFVAKYIIFGFFLTAVQGMQVALIIYGSRKPHYFTYEHEDGFKRLRYAYLIADKITFLCLATCTLCERVFFDKWIALYKRLCVKNHRRPRTKKQLIDGQSKKGENSIEFESLNDPKSLHNSLSSSEDDDDFEGGDNCLNNHKDEIDQEDESKFEKIVEEDQETRRDSMSLQQKTNYFIINAVLMSICNCILSQKKEQNVVGMMTGLVKFAQKVLTYQLKDNDINHIIDMAKFYEKNKEICVSDVTNGKRVQIKITEFGPEMLKSLRRQSGYNDEFLINAFSPKENETEMARFQEGSGKSASFFFFTANKQFVIKTLKDAELELLARKGVLEKYYNHVSKNPKSLLARFYGIFTVKIKFMKPINVIIMDNLMGEHVEDALRIYDLKGSTFQRINSNPSSALSVRKDLNFIEDKEFRMQVNEKVQKDLLQRMIKDKEFLKTCHLMDYSMLIIFFKDDDLKDEESNISGDLSRNSARKHLSVYVQKGENGNELRFSQEDQPPHLLIKSSVSSNDINEKHGGDQDIKPKDQQENSIEFDQFMQEPPGGKGPKFTMPFLKTGTQVGPKPSILMTMKQHLRADTLMAKIEPSNNQNNLQKNLKPKANEFIQFPSSSDKTVYYRLGIIDFLQKYNRRKRIETRWLQFRNRNVDPETFSCVDPKLYADRFYKYMKENMFKSDIRLSDLE